ncbi:phage portal protein [Algoriphagus aquimarinus]|uniref:phage portal protein n=1 Tax=Algoriphagus aquimarinus TaxID=237018 RepID=UPI0030D7EDF4|tara:strand:- start:44535 stop:45749 length:1215 start_codon:yes stop_codon:yes gene_type:complete
MNIKHFLGIEKKLYIPSVISLDEIGLGEDVTDKALTIASFWKGVNIISNSVASFPFRVYRDKQVIKENELYYLLKHKPNEFQTSFEFFNTMILIMLLKGNAFALITRNESGDVQSLDIINYSTVEAIMANGKLYFKFDDKGDKTILNSDLIHFKNVGAGFLGEDLVSNFKKNIQINVNSTDYTNKVYTGEAASVRGTITYDKALNDKQKEVMRKELSSNFSGSNGKRILFLEDGMQLNNINLDPSQTQFLESREFETQEIANMLNLPPFMLKSERNTSSGIEQDNIHFYQTSLMPLVTKIEQEIQAKLFTKKETMEGYYVKASVNALLRGDSKARGEFYKSLFYLGAISPEEIRELEDMSDVINGETYIQANLIPKKIINRFWDSKAALDYAKENEIEAKIKEE